MRKLLISAIILGVTGCQVPWMQPSAAALAAADYGPFPENYESLLKEYIRTNFFDPYSVQDLKIQQPVKGWIKEPAIQGGHFHFGYLLTFECNAKNRQGGYVGLKTSQVFIRDSKVQDIPPGP
jgi:hypothetical protein